MKNNAFSYIKDVSNYIGLGFKKYTVPLFSSATEHSSEETVETLDNVVQLHHPSRMHLQVMDIIPQTKSTKTFRMQRIDGPMPFFIPGQYITLTIELDTLITTRPYTISSSPNERYIDLTIKQKPNGAVSSYLLQHAEIGDEFWATGPMGHFYYEPISDGNELVFLAGGSGITPFMSMIRNLYEEKNGVTVHLIYGCRFADDIIFREELDHLVTHWSSFNYSVVISEPPEGYNKPCGLITKEVIVSFMNHIENKTVFICGPPDMTAYCLNEIKAAGIQSFRIRYELFHPPEAITNEAGWNTSISGDDLFDIHIEGNSKRSLIKAKASVPILQSLESEGVLVPTNCRSGICGACRTQIKSGKVFIAPQSQLRESDQQFGYVHLCTAYPQSDLYIKLP